MIHRTRAPAAFLVIEALIAAGVLAITALTIYPLFGTSQQLKTASKFRILAINFARETMESLRSKRITDLHPGESVEPIRPETHPFNTHLRAKRQVLIEDVTGPGFGERSRSRAAGRGKLIVVTVTWDALELGPKARGEERLVLFRSNALPLLLFP